MFKLMVSRAFDELVSNIESDIDTVLPLIKGA